MHFDLDDDERALQAAIRDLCGDRLPAGRLAELEGNFDQALWRDLGDAGVFSLRLDEAQGGAGLGLTQAVVVFEELGRALVPGPLVATETFADTVPQAATGEHVLTLVDHAAGPLLVEHLADADAVVVLDDAGARLCKPGDLEGTPVTRPLDPLTPLHRVERLAEGEPLGGPADAEQWRRNGALLTAALLVGAAQATTDMAVRHAQQREQFGQPIGAFQAVKHLCADMLVRTEVARAAVHSAGVMSDDPATGDARRATAGAKLLASEAAVANGKACVQVHGGMGFTWEVDVHRYLKRAVVWSTQFGAPSSHAEVVAEGLA